MEIERKVLLSLAKYVTDVLVASGWSNVTLVKRFPEDESKITFSGLPMVSLYPGPAYEGSLCGIGMETHSHSSAYMSLLYAQTDGQEMDLRQFLAKSIYNCTGILYNFPSGYPASGVEEGILRVGNVSHRAVYDISNPNVALRYAGIINFNILTEIT